jgi:phosphoribosyl-ATP pyrophosphohydrolase/phosphoribosyl-AMP cyclohydrolase
VSNESWLDGARFGPDGLIPVIAQDELNGNVLMLAWANRDALAMTARSGQAHYWSRSRQALWRKGERSGHEQRVSEVRLDCDGDAILYRVAQTGPACHTGSATCFSAVIATGASGALDLSSNEGSPAPVAPAGGHLLTRLATTIAERAKGPAPESYTAKLLGQGVGKVAQKVGEEAVEVVVAATSESPERLASESADLLYHLLVLLRARGVEFTDVLKQLQAREK